MRRYVADTLGSTAKLTDTSGTVTDSIEYWPYGEERTRTGTTATPFTFVGTLGYYKDQAGRLYVRARTYLAKYARWLTVDPLWPMESAYGYAADMPVIDVDPAGLAPCSFDPRPCSCGEYRSKAISLGFLAYVVCCPGKKPEVCFTKKLGKVVEKCARIHEEDHISQITFVCDVGLGGWSSKGDQAYGECYGYIAELECLSKNCKSGDKECKARICVVCENARFMCGKAGLRLNPAQKAICKKNKCKGF